MTRRPGPGSRAPYHNSTCLTPSPCFQRPPPPPPEAAWKEAGGRTPPFRARTRFPPESSWIPERFTLPRQQSLRLYLQSRPRAQHSSPPPSSRHCGRHRLSPGISPQHPTCSDSTLPSIVFPAQQLKTYTRSRLSSYSLFIYLKNF